MRHSTILFTFISAAALSLTACGGGGDNGDDTADIDASTGNIDAGDSPDAPGGNATQVGDPCVPDAQDPMGPGDCDAGFTCLNLQGGNGAWCSKACTPGAGDVCPTGYTGPGISQCLFGITFEKGGPATNFCGVICEDIAGDPVVCDPATACDGTCPGTLQCSAPLSETQGGPTVANACI